MLLLGMPRNQSAVPAIISQQLLTGLLLMKRASHGMCVCRIQTAGTGLAPILPARGLGPRGCGLISGPLPCGPLFGHLISPVQGFCHISPLLLMSLPIPPAWRALFQNLQVAAPLREGFPDCAIEAPSAPFTPSVFIFSP